MENNYKYEKYQHTIQKSKHNLYAFYEQNVKDLPFMQLHNFHDVR